MEKPNNAQRGETTCGVDRKQTDDQAIKNGLAWCDVRSDQELRDLVKQNSLILEEGNADGVRISQISWYYHNILNKNTAVVDKLNNTGWLTATSVVRRSTSCYRGKPTLWVIYTDKKSCARGARQEEPTSVGAGKYRIFKKPQFDTGLPRVRGVDYFSPLRKSRIYIKSRFSRVRQWCRPIVI